MRPWPVIICFLALPVHAQQGTAGPDDLDTLPTRAEAELGAELDKAILSYRDFIAANPDSEYTTAARFRLASLLITRADDTGDAAADYSPAVTELRTVLEAVEQGRAGDFTQVAEALYLLGWCLRHAQPQQASDAWSQVATMAPDSELGRSSMMQLGQQAMDAGAWDQAERHFEGARTGGPDDPTWPQATYLLAFAQYKLERWEPARQSFQAVLSTGQPGAGTLHAEALEYLALVLLEGSVRQGWSVTRDLDTTLAAVPTNLQPDLLQRLARLLEESARFDEAEEVTRWGQQSERRKRRRRKQD